MAMAAAIERRPTEAAAQRQPKSSARVGSTAPQIAKPTGTPLCFSEKVTLASRGGDTRARMCELAMVSGPEPRPTMKAESAAIARPPVAKTKEPSAAIVSPVWMKRIGPSRRVSVPPPTVEIIAAR
jgi:hypothetical protein